MLIKTRRGRDIPSSEITPENIYKSRRDFMLDSGKLALGAGVTAGLGSTGALAQPSYEPVLSNAQDLNLAAKPAWLSAQIAASTPVPLSGPYITDEELTPFTDVTTYNNFYEFGTDKADPSRNASDFKVEPWKVEVSGEVAKPGSYNLEDLLKGLTLEDRIYRLRCVEAWSMVIPWVGVPLAALINKLEPTGNAKFIEFTTLVDRDQMSAQRSRFASIDWPYREGLRMDEAMHPLTLMAVGLYGDVLPAQNGAPFRLVVPWKYGFKSIKSIVKINFTSKMPNNTWNDLQPSEYGFYANVNPAVSHPRWSQATERRLPTSLFMPRRVETMPFNGYADEVAGMYAGMDLRKFY